MENPWPIARLDLSIGCSFGPVIYHYLLEARQAHWRDSFMHVHPWEVEHYLEYYWATRRRLIRIAYSERRQNEGAQP